MSVIVNRYTPKTFGANDCIITGSFQTNGATTGAIVASTILSPRGTLSMTVTQSASVSGLYTVSIPYGITFYTGPWALTISPEFATLATDWFSVGQLGTVTQTAGVLSFQVQCHRSGTAQAPAATAGNRINFILVAGDTTGG